MRRNPLSLSADEVGGVCPSPAGAGEGARRADEGGRVKNKSCGPELTVYENVRLAVQSRLKAAYNFLISFKSLNGVAEKTEKVLRDVGLYSEADVIAKNLSYGLQRCLDIGISLATEPKIILLDEPTSGLSQEDANRIIRLVSEISKNIPVLVIEHNIDIVLSISDVITVLYQGGVLAEGPASAITSNQKVQEAYLGGI